MIEITGLAVALFTLLSFYMKDLVNSIIFVINIRRGLKLLKEDI